MTRKQLEDLGLTKEQADSVMKINGDDIENAKDTAATEIKNLQTEVDGLKTQVGDRDKQLETLKASAGDNADLKKQIEDLQTENATAKANHESELNQLKIDFAVEKALTGAKAKNIKAVKALLELNDAKLDKDGNVKGLAEQIEKLTSGDDTKFLFEAQKQTKQQQNFKGFQPGASGEQKPGEGEKVDFSKMSYDELTAYMEANPDAQI
ncbi:MAG: hypothetical protein DBX56_04780 [Coriobacteriia bacterium]|nr:MAG: hypothetical protein DBX56_04780 [Coriobacteriia bacterium]